MNDRDFHLLERAKRQIRQDTTRRSWLWVGIVLVAVMRMVGVEAPIMYRLLLALIMIALILSSDLLPSFGRVSKKDLVGVIDRHIHNDPEALTRFSEVRTR